MIYLFIILQGLYLGSDGQPSFSFPSQIQGLKDSCVEIPCTYSNPRFPSNPSVAWYLFEIAWQVVVLNIRDSSTVNLNYRNRTSLVKKEINSCTLRIDRVRREDSGDYYPRTLGNRQINPFIHNGKMVHLSIEDSPAQPQFVMPGEMTEGSPVFITCSAQHTCASTPPSLQWNKIGQPIHENHMDLGGGTWRAISELTYHPSYEDHGKEIHCRATYPNGQSYQQKGTANIKYPPKNTQVVIENKELKEGNDVTLSCSSNSNPAIQTYEWFKGKEKDKLIDQDQQIIVKNVHWDSEPYACSAVNELGRGESALMTIPVEHAAKNVNIITTDEVEGYLELKCDFVSSRPDVTHYTWIRNETVLNQTQQILILRHIATNVGKYYCVAHNTAGSTSSPSLEITDFINLKRNRFFLRPILGFVAVIIVILVILVVYLCIRKRKYQKALNVEKSGTKGTLSSDAAYTDLLQRNSSEEYAELQPQSNFHLAGRRTHTVGSTDYENDGMQ
ncbi:B-cell receptor CD22-like [Discoglossus pictus]